MSVGGHLVLKRSKIKKFNSCMKTACTIVNWHCESVWKTSI